MKGEGGNLWDGGRASGWEGQMEELERAEGREGEKGK